MTYMADAYDGPLPSILDLPGVAAMALYISRDPGKCTTKEKVAAVQARGFQVVLNFEDSATRALDGAAAGEEDAAWCIAKSRELGAVVGSVIVPSYDYAYLDSRWAPTLGYGQKICLGIRPTGFVPGGYGDFTTSGLLRTDGLIDVQWQTSAWSSGRIDTRAHLYQHIYAPSYDLSDIRAAWFGGWGKNGAQTQTSAGGVQPAASTSVVTRKDDKTMLLGYQSNNQGAHLCNLQDGVGWRVIRDVPTEVALIDAGAVKLHFGPNDFAVHVKEANVNQGKGL